MATVSRQPFAPLDGTRLQTLTSLKNRQNAVSPPSPGKRKAVEAVEDHDGENVDPVLFSKRSKGVDSASSLNDFIKPTTLLITKSSSTGSIANPLKSATPRPRNVLQPKSPAARINTGIAKPSPLSAPAGRSPTRGKRAGILSSRRRIGGPYTRVDPPSFGLKASSGATAPFSLDAALKGTIPSYTGRSSSVATPTPTPRSLGLTSLDEPDSKSSWFFDIHEDSPEQEMTNLLQHSTCVLDISSDEESEDRLQRERAEGKENVPPADDVSQTSRPRALRQAANADDMIVEKERSPLGEMNAKEYYAEGCDDASVVIVPGDEEEEQLPTNNEARHAPRALELPRGESTAPEPVVKDGAKSVDELMRKTAELAATAAVLAPIEGTGESFEVWESGSTKDEPEATATS